MVWLGSEQRLSLDKDPRSSIFFRALEAPTLREMRGLWESLRGKSVSTPFQTPEFLFAFQDTQCNPGETDLSVISFSDREGCDAPFMLLPLVRYRRGPLRVVGLADFGLADQNAPVLAAGMPAPPTPLAEAVGAYLAGLDGVDLVDMPKLHSHIGERNNPLFSQPDTISESNTLRLELAAGGDTSAWRRKSIYKKARSKFRRLTEEGVRLVEAATPAERLALFRTLAEQRNDRFSQLGREDSLTRQERLNFYECLAALETSECPFTVLALERGDEIVATLVLLKNDLQATAVLVSIGDARWHGYSPGMVLFAKAIEWASENGVRWFSFGTGQQDYKQRFGGQPQETRRLLMPLNSRGRLFLRAREAHRTAQELLQIAIGKNGLRT